MLQPTDPTDPEVPAAKRLRALRRKRTLVVAGIAVVTLLFALLALLYRMGQQVTTARPASMLQAAPGSPQEDFVKESPGVPNPSEGARTAEPSMQTAPSAAPPSASGHSGAVVAEPPPASPKPPTNREIFRRPTF